LLYSEHRPDDGSKEETRHNVCRLCNREAGMSLNTNDLRVQKTLDSIRDALVALVAKKSLDSVTVGDITRRARVNRTTFYRHYKDKYDLLERILTKAIEELDESMGPPQSRRSRFQPNEVPEP